jgi:surface protein
MKKLLLLILGLFLSSQTIKAQVVLDANGVTIKWTGTTVPSPYFVQASPRGTLEWFAIVSDATKSNISDYAGYTQTGIAYFTRPGSSTPIPIDNIITSLVTDMSFMFANNFYFNQDISSWDVSNVTEMQNMFGNAKDFDHPIGSWNVSKVTDMTAMFGGANSFNQNISSWNVSKVTSMTNMFAEADNFNQPIGSWNVSKVTSMDGMFNLALDFDQNISSWNVSNVVYMQYMFAEADDFDQPIGSWNVSKVTDMTAMFGGADTFNQNIGSWDVSNVSYMDNILSESGLSTANYDLLLLGWLPDPFDNPLKQNVSFDVSSNYCNGASARQDIINWFGWTITDAGLDCSSLVIEELESSKVKLYPNPVISELNVTIDYHLIDEPYVIIDGLGRVVLEGKFKEVESTINLKELAKGIYYLKTSNSYSSKFIKE